MYNEGSYREKTVNAVKAMWEEYKRGRITAEELTAWRKAVTENQKKISEAVSEYSLMGLHMKKVMYEENLTKEEKAQELAISQATLEKSDEKIQEGITALKQLIPGFTAASTSSEMFLVAVKLMDENMAALRDMR